MTPSEPRKTQRARIWWRDSVQLETTGERYALCYLCRCTLSYHTTTLDHVVPLSRGGSHDDTNVRLCCSTCNSRKGDKII